MMIHKQTITVMIALAGALAVLRVSRMADHKGAGN